MAKGWEGITSDGKSIQVTGKEKMNGYSPSLNISNDTGVNFTETPKSPLGGKDFLSMETPFPINLVPVVPSKVPTGVPLQEYLAFLPMAKKALAISLISTGIAKAKKEIGKKVAK
jgi:hypothetical protein